MVPRSCDSSRRNRASDDCRAAADASVTAVCGAIVVVPAMARSMAASSDGRSPKAEAPVTSSYSTRPRLY
jgi:hypothetical protein